jgi:hypothetical protein
LIGNRAAKGQPLVSAQTVKSVKDAAAVLKTTVDSVIPNLPGTSSKAKRTQWTSSKKAFSEKKSDRTARKCLQTETSKKKPVRNSSVNLADLGLADHMFGPRGGHERFSTAAMIHR